MNKNTQLRVLVGAPLGFAMAFLVLYSPTIVAMGICSLFAVRCWHEYARMTDLQKHKIFYWSGFVAVLALICESFRHNGLSYHIVFFVFVGSVLLLYLDTKLFSKKQKAVVQESSKDIWSILSRFQLGLFYIVLTFAFVMPILNMPKGREYLLLCISAVAWCDICAYFVGRKFGKHKIWPELSPKKSVEGFFGGVIGAATLGVATFQLFMMLSEHTISTQEAVYISLALAPLAQMGDFFESMMKRATGIKDSGSLLPGHGGLLDRVDGFAFAIPALYYYLS